MNAFFSEFHLICERVIYTLSMCACVCATSCTTFNVRSHVYMSDRIYLTVFYLMYKRINILIDLEFQSILKFE